MYKKNNKHKHFTKDEKQYILDLVTNASNVEVEGDLLFNERLMTKLRDW